MLIGKRFKNRSTTRHRIIIARIQITIIKIKCRIKIIKNQKKHPVGHNRVFYIQKHREQKRKCPNSFSIQKGNRLYFRIIHCRHVCGHAGRRLPAHRHQTKTTYQNNGTYHLEQKNNEVQTPTP